MNSPSIYYDFGNELIHFSFDLLFRGVEIHFLSTILGERRAALAPAGLAASRAGRRSPHRPL